jgi:DNA-binding transcriptional LysR family regulator
MPNAMNWDDVRVFLAVAEHGALASGARAAGLDRSTASRRIDHLERSLGARLFLRGRDGLRLTAAGQRLLTAASRMSEGAAAIATAAREEAAQDGRIVGRVRVASTEGIAALLARDGLASLRARHPGLELELLAGNRSVDLERGEAELAVRVSAVRSAALRVRRLARLTLALFASTGYLRARGRPRNPSELAGHDVVIGAAELEALPEFRWLASVPGVRVALRTNSMPTVVAAMSAGLGVSALAGAWGARESGLERLFDLPQIPARPLFLVGHPDALGRPAVRAVADAIATSFREAR